MSAEALRDRLRSSLGAWPAIAVVVSIGAALGLVELDEALGTRSAGFSGGADSARSVLSTIAASMVTLTGLVFSITIVALQLASSQYSPRVMRTFLRDRQSKLALASFVATFAFAFMVLRAVRTDFVPGLSVNVAIVLVLLSVGMLIQYIAHIAQTIRIASIVESVGAETRDAIERLYPRDAPAPAAPPVLGQPRRTIAMGDAPGVLVAVRGDALAATAREHDSVLELLAPVGTFIPGGTPIVAVHGGDLEDEAVLACLDLERERTMVQDAGFGLRQLVDIAEKALSPSINDPTTAVQAMDQMHDALRRLAVRRLVKGRIADADGEVRVVVPEPSWADYVDLAVDEVRQYAAPSLQAARHLRAMLRALIDVAPADREAPLRRQLELLDAAIEREVPDAGDRAAIAAHSPLAQEQA